MKRILRAACLAMLGLSIAGYATFVFGQTPTTPPVTPVTPGDVTLPPLPMPAPSGPPAPVSLPGTPALPTPVAPMLPTPMPPMGQVAPLTPMTPGGPALPDVPAKPVDVLPLPGVDAAKTPITVPDAKTPVTIPDNKTPITLPGAPTPPMDVTPTAPPTTDDTTGGAELAGRQEPAVSLEWIGPPATKLGQAADYSIIVRNVCNIPVQQVMVRVRLPQGVTVTGTEPKAVAEENVLMWEVGTMLPKQERNLQLKMAAGTKGDATCQAWVTFTGASTMKIRVREPKLLVKATAPEKVLVGDGCVFVLTVSNPGDHPAEQVKIHAELTDGLESARGSKIDFEVGNLAAGETRSVQVLCGAKTGGAQHCEVFAEAEGGLKTTDKAGVNVLMPQIKVEVVGPKLRYLDRKAKYTVKVTNPGDAPASNVVVSDEIPTGFKFLSADNSGRHDYATRTVSWFLGEYLGAGQSREMSMEVLAVNKGVHEHKFTAQASRGLKDAQAFPTRIEGLSAIMLEMVDLEDPVEVNGETTYEIRITNTGSQTETDVKLICVVPDKLQFKSASGPAVRYTQNGSEIVFEALPKLAPRADAIFRVTCKAGAPGVAIFKTKITSTLLVDPVTKEEATRVYTD